MSNRNPIVVVTMEIHNHFGAGCSAHVFNDQVIIQSIRKKLCKGKPILLSEQKVKRVKQQWKKRVKQQWKEKL